MDEKRLEGAANSAAGKAEAAYGRVTGNAAAQAKGTAHDATGAAQRIYGQAKDVAMDAAENLGETASDIASQVVETGGAYYRQGNRAIASTIRHQPLAALLAAGAAGFVLALLINRPPPRRRPRWADLR
jgi:uncharacterized protein YjbJ (UPF0337 family)